MSEKMDVIGHFDRYAEEGKWSQLYDSKDLAKNYSFIVRKHRVEELLHHEVVAGARVLDIGCGTGVMAPFFAGKQTVYYGLDASQRMIEQARSEWADLLSKSDKVRFEIGDVTGLSYADKFFDIVIALGLFEYLDDCDAAMRELARVTREGGVVVVTVPTRFCVQRLADKCFSPVVTRGARLTRRILSKRSTKGHFQHNLFRPSELDALFARHGCRTVAKEYYNVELLFYPFNRLLPGLALWLKKKAERFRHRLSFYATGYIGKAKKERSAAQWPQ